MLKMYLCERLGTPALYFRTLPTELPDGWEAYTYAFQLERTDAVPPQCVRPLILRIYHNTRALLRVRHEFAVERHLYAMGYPVAGPLLLEERRDYFGGPFLIRAHAPGQTLLTTLLRRPWRIVQVPGLMAETHAWLHRLPIESFPRASGDLLTRSLETMGRTIRERRLCGLKPGLDWLEAHRPRAPLAPSILHLDFHPINLIQPSNGPLTVLDWTEAGVGDRHADLATTLMLMDCVIPGGTSLRDRLSILVGRFFLSRWYLRAYRKRLRISEGRLSYYRAWATLRRLCQYGKWLCAGPMVDGCKPSALQHLSSKDVLTLEKYFQRWTEIDVRV